MNRTARSKRVEGAAAPQAHGPEGALSGPGGSLSQFLRERVPLGQACDPEGVMTVLRELVHMWGEPRAHRRYFGPAPAMSTVAGALCDALVSLAKPPLGGRGIDGLGEELERYVLGYLGGCLGLEGLESAHVVGDAGQAHQIALRAALYHRFPSAVTFGSGSIVRPRMYVSEGADRGFEAAALASGLGSAAVQRIPTDGHQRMRVDALRQRIAADLSAAMKPFLIVGTAGTWATGAIDPLEPLGHLAEAHGLWLHVDASWGGVLGWSARERAGLEGIGWADSVAGEAQRWLAAPLEAGLLFCRHREALRKVSALGAVPAVAGSPRGGGGVVAAGLGRELLGLKMLLFLAQHDRTVLAARLERQCLVREMLRRRLMAAGFALIGQSRLPVVCFTHTRLRQEARRHHYLVEELKQRQIAHLTWVALANGMPVLRACIAHEETDAQDIEALIAGVLERMAGLENSPEFLH